PLRSSGTAAPRQRTYPRHAVFPAAGIVRRCERVDAKNSTKRDFPHLPAAGLKLVDNLLHNLAVGKLGDRTGRRLLVDPQLLVRLDPLVAKQSQKAFFLTIQQLTKLSSPTFQFLPRAVSKGISFSRLVELDISG